MSSQPIPLARADHVLVVDMAHAERGVRGPDGTLELCTPEGLVVERGVPLAASGPVVEALELHAEHRRLQLIEPEIPADERVVVLWLPAVHAQHLAALGERRILGDAHAGIAEGAEVLRGKEREAPDVAEAAGALALGVRRADRLRRILADFKAVAPRARAAI